MPKIRNTAKQIVVMLLEQAIRNGDMSVFFDYDEVMKRLSIEDKNYLKVCLLYLYDAKYLIYQRNDDDNFRLVQITSKGIDFAEDI